MPRMEMDWKLSPQFFVSSCNLVAIIFGIGMVWASTTGDVTNNKKAIDDLRIEVRSLRAQDTSIAVIKTDIQYVKESMARIEQRLDKANVRP